jgi:D-sedoheptulose 7-phosphate isomerase
MTDQIKDRIQQAIQAHLQNTMQMQKNNLDKIAEISDMITSALRTNGTIYICGNGGSAADAQHIAAELVGRFCRERKALAAVAMTTDTSILTSISNDYGYDKVFARQVQALVRKSDILWAFSTSGESINIIEAAKSAKEKQALVIAFTNKPQSSLEKISDICLCTDTKSTAQSQEMHQLAYHIICDIVEGNFSGDNK